MQLLDALTTLYVLYMLAYDLYGRNKTRCIGGTSVVHVVENSGLSRGGFACALAFGALFYGRAWAIAASLLYGTGGRAAAPVVTAFVVASVGPTWVRAAGGLAALAPSSAGVGALASFVVGLWLWVPIMWAAAEFQWRWASTVGAALAGALSLAVCVGADTALVGFARAPSPEERAFAAWVGLVFAVGAAVLRARAVLVGVRTEAAVSVQHAAGARRFAGACVVEDPARTVTELRDLGVPRPLALIVGQYQALRDTFALHLDDVASHAADWRLVAPAESRDAHLCAVLTEERPFDRALLLMHAATAKAVRFQLPVRRCWIVAGSAQAPTRVWVENLLHMWCNARVPTTKPLAAFVERVVTNERWLEDTFPGMTVQGMWRTLDTLCHYCPLRMGYPGAMHAPRLAPTHALLRTFVIYYCRGRYQFVAVEPSGEAAVVGGAPQPGSHECQADNTLLDFSERVPAATEADPDTDTVPPTPA